MSDRDVAGCPAIDPRKYATVSHVWPSRFECYLVCYQDSHWTWIEIPGKAAQVHLHSTGDAASKHLAEQHARLLLALPAESAILAVSAGPKGPSGPRFAAVAACDPSGDGHWLAEHDATSGPAIYRANRYESSASVFRAFADATEAAADRIESAGGSWPDITAAYLRSQAQLARAGASRAELGDVLRARGSDIRRRRAAAEAAAAAGISEKYLYDVLAGKVLTWQQSAPARPDLLFGQRLQRIPAVTTACRVVLAIAAQHREQAQPIGVAVLDRLGIKIDGGPTVAELRPGLWEIAADASRPSRRHPAANDPHDLAVQVASRAPGALTWTPRETQGGVRLDWPPDVWSPHHGGTEMLINPAVRAAAIIVSGIRARTKAPGRPGAHPASGEAKSETGQHDAARIGRVFAKVSQRFGRLEAREHALDLLLSLASLPARPATEATLRRRSYLVSSSPWSESAVLDDLVRYVGSIAGSNSAVLSVGEFEFPKHGHESAGIYRRAAGTHTEPASCQLGIFLAYAVPGGPRTLIDRELYLPPEWIDDHPRRQAAGVNPDIGYASQGSLARAMISRVIAAQLPFRWIVAGPGYSHDHELRRWLEEHAIGYLLALPPDFTPGPATPTAWQQVAATADGVAGAQLDAWALVPAGSGRSDNPDLLLARRQGSSQITYYSFHSPGKPSLPELAAAALQSRAAADCVLLGRARAGLDSYRVTSYRGWYRHVTLSLLTLAALSLPAPEEPPHTAAALELTPADEPAPSMAGRRIREARVAKGLSQDQLAGDLMSPSYLSLLETGRRALTADLLEELAQRLATTAAELSSGDSRTMPATTAQLKRGPKPRKATPAIGRRIREARQERGLSQEQLARGLMSSSHLSLIENGRRAPSRELLEGLAQRLGATVASLKSGRRAPLGELPPRGTPVGGPERRDSRVTARLEALAVMARSLDRQLPGEPRTSAGHVHPDNQR